MAVRPRKSASQADTATVFSSRLSLLLIFPLIKSQAARDPGLASVTTQLLLESLRQCPALSLKEPADCLDGLEDLLASWLGETRQADSLETSAAALVTLACARNSSKTVLHTVYLLEKIKTISSLPVYDILYILGALEGGPSLAATLSGTRHLASWAYDDQLGCERERPGEEVDQGEEVAGRSLTTDGSYLYLTNLRGEGLAKVGTGLHGSIRGVIYCRKTSAQLTPDLGPGFVAFAAGVLLHRAYSLDGGESSVLARLVDTTTLDLLEDINIIPDLELEVEVDSPGSVTTLALTTNGMEFYWVRSVKTNSTQFSHLILLDVFTVDPQTRTVRQFQPRKILSKREESGDKLPGIEAILQPKRPIRTSSSHSGLEPSSPAGSSQPQNCVKDNNSTSVGLGYKTLVSCPILTCGNYITIISPPASPNTPTSQLSRSLFSSTAGMSKILAVSNTFSVKDGLFNSRTDLSDAQYSAFNKGVTLSNMSATFDTFNNCIWTAAPDYVDQFFNPGHPAASFTARRLGIDITDKKPTTKEDNMASVQLIISTLIEHTALMCCHTMSNELSLSASSLLSDKVVDINHLRRVLHLLEDAVVKRDEKSIRCYLVVTQYIMITSNLEKLTESEREILPRLERLLWEICKSGGGELNNTTREACNTIIAALGPLYPSNQDKNDLLYNLLMTEQCEPGLCLLKDLMLNKYSKVFFQSKEENISRMKSLRGALNLTSLILKKTCEEGTEMIDKLTSMAELDFNRFFYSIPTVSPSLHYISTLVSSLLADLLEAGGGVGDVREDREVFDDISDQLLDCSHSLLAQLSQKVDQVCTDYSGAELELRLSSVDKILKSSIISHVFLPLVTTMLDPAITSLDLCEATILKLVQLYDLACQISQRIRSSPGQPSQQKDFLSEIKIPTPWAAGRILESCHPLRDNYKFKETIKIPGARCLFIKFDPRCSSQYDYDKLVLHAGQCQYQYFLMCLLITTDQLISDI